MWNLAVSTSSKEVLNCGVVGSVGRGNTLYVLCMCSLGDREGTPLCRVLQGRVGGGVGVGGVSGKVKCCQLQCKREVGREERQRRCKIKPIPTPTWETSEIKSFDRLIRKGHKSWG